MNSRFQPSTNSTVFLGSMKQNWIMRFSGWFLNPQINPFRKIGKKRQQNFSPAEQQRSIAGWVQGVFNSSPWQALHVHGHVLAVALPKWKDLFFSGIVYVRIQASFWKNLIDFQDWTMASLTKTLLKLNSSHRLCPHQNGKTIRKRWALWFHPLGVPVFDSRSLIRPCIGSWFFLPPKKTPKE